MASRAAIDRSHDGEGHRVEQQWTTSGTTTTLVYVGDIEKINLTAGVETSLYSVQGQRLALSSGGTLLYLGNDVLGSPTAILTASGSLDAAHLYGPYGTVRYSTGSWPAAGGYTGQWSDGPSGLNYFVARYYDTGVGDFTSADTINAGLDRYAYVGDNPETLTDPSGHCAQTDAQGGAGSLQCGSGTGSGCGAYQTCPTKPKDPPKDPPKPKPTCTTRQACEDTKRDLQVHLMLLGALDLGIGALIILITDYLRLQVDKSDITKELQDVIGFFVQLVTFLPAITAAFELLGAPDWVGNVADSLTLGVNAALGTLRAAQSAIQMWGQWGTLLKWGAQVISAVVTGAEGPFGVLMQVGVEMFGSAAVNAGAAVGYYFLQKGAHEASEAGALIGEDTRAWCQNTPGACAQGTDW